MKSFFQRFNDPQPAPIQKDTRESRSRSASQQREKKRSSSRQPSIAGEKYATLPPNTGRKVLTKRPSNPSAQAAQNARLKVYPDATLSRARKASDSASVTFDYSQKPAHNRSYTTPTTTAFVPAIQSPPPESWNPAQPTYSQTRGLKETQKREPSRDRTREKDRERDRQKEHRDRDREHVRSRDKDRGEDRERRKDKERREREKEKAVTRERAAEDTVKVRSKDGEERTRGRERSKSRQEQLEGDRPRYPKIEPSSSRGYNDGRAEDGDSSDSAVYPNRQIASKRIRQTRRDDSSRNAQLDRTNTASNLPPLAPPSLYPFPVQPTAASSTSGGPTPKAMPVFLPNKTSPPEQERLAFLPNDNNQNYPESDPEASAKRQGGRGFFSTREKIKNMDGQTVLKPKDLKNMYPKWPFTRSRSSDSEEDVKPTGPVFSAPAGVASFFSGRIRKASNTSQTSSTKNDVPVSKKSAIASLREVTPEIQATDGRNLSRSQHRRERSVPHEDPNFLSSQKSAAPEMQNMRGDTIRSGSVALPDSVSAQQAGQSQQKDVSALRDSEKQSRGYTAGVPEHGPSIPNISAQSQGFVPMDPMQVKSDKDGVKSPLLASPGSAPEHGPYIPQAPNGPFNPTTSYGLAPPSIPATANYKIDKVVGINDASNGSPHRTVVTAASSASPNKQQGDVRNPKLTEIFSAPPVTDLTGHPGEAPHQPDKSRYSSRQPFDARGPSAVAEASLSLNPPNSSSNASLSHRHRIKPNDTSQLPSYDTAHDLVSSSQSYHPSAGTLHQRQQPGPKHQPLSNHRVTNEETGYNNHFSDEDSARRGHTSITERPKATRTNSHQSIPAPSLAQPHQHSLSLPGKIPPQNLPISTSSRKDTVNKPRTDSSTNDKYAPLRREPSEESVLKTPSSIAQSFMKINPSKTSVSNSLSSSQQEGRKKGLLGIFRSKAPSDEESPYEIWHPPGSKQRGRDKTVRARFQEPDYSKSDGEKPLSSLASRSQIPPPISIPIPVPRGKSPNSKVFTPFRYLTSKRNRTMSAASVEAVDGTAPNTIGSPTASMHSTQNPSQPPPSRDPYTATQEWRNREEADAAGRGQKGKKRQRPGVVFDVPQEIHEDRQGTRFRFRGRSPARYDSDTTDS